MNSVFIIFGLCFVLCTCLTYSTKSIQCNPLPGTPVNYPIGKPQGIVPGRVVWSYNKNCCYWNEAPNTFWWNSIDQRVVDSMMENTILKLTEQKTVEDSWRLIFKDFNQKKFGRFENYKKGEKIAIKVNLNGDYEGSNTNCPEVSPHFLISLIKQLSIFVPYQDITIYEASRIFSEHYLRMIKTKYPVNFIDNVGNSQYDVKRVKPDLQNSTLYFSNNKILAYDQTSIPMCVSHSKYLIIVNNFRGHQIAGLTASPKNFFGSIYRPKDNCEFLKSPKWCPRSLHQWVNVTAHPMGSYTPLVDLLGFFTEKALLVFTDGLYAGEHQSSTVPLKFKMSPFYNSWTSSIFASQDPVAMDSVLYDFLRNEPTIPWSKSGCIDNYLHESALADNPPSMTTYKPNGRTRLNSLGVHEHWTDQFSKKYSGNYGKPLGIELVQVN